MNTAQSTQKSKSRECETTSWSHTRSGDEVEGFFVKTTGFVDDGEGCVSVGGGEPTVGRGVGTLVGGIVVGDPV